MARGALALGTGMLVGAAIVASQEPPREEVVVYQNGPPVYVVSSPARPGPPPPPPAPAPLAGFNAAAARASLDGIELGACREQGAPLGYGHARVTFNPDGSVGQRRHRLAGRPLGRGREVHRRGARHGDGPGVQRSRLGRTDALLRALTVQARTKGAQAQRHRRQTRGARTPGRIAHPRLEALHTAALSGTVDDLTPDKGHRPARAVPYLVVALEGERPTAGGARYSLEGIDCVTLGRGEGRAASRRQDRGVHILDVVVPEASMSAAHARIVRTGDAWLVEDAGSTNGTFVNGARVTRAALAEDDVVTAGRTLFLLAPSRMTPLGAPGFGVESLRSDARNIQRPLFGQQRCGGGNVPDSSPWPLPRAAPFPEES